MSPIEIPHSNYNPLFAEQEKTMTALVGNSGTVPMTFFMYGANIDRHAGSLFPSWCFTPMYPLPPNLPAYATGQPFPSRIPTTENLSRGQNMGERSYPHWGEINEHRAAASSIAVGITHSSVPAQSLSSVVQQQEESKVSATMKQLVAHEPAIPSCPVKGFPIRPLENLLIGERNRRNVYISGLLPETTDEMLRTWSARFGGIEMLKAITDDKTGRCKGCETSIVAT